MKKSAARGIYPALRGVIGDWVYYSTVMSAHQIHDSIVFSRNIREEKSLEDHLQRDLGNRVEAIKDYLFSHESRFFNSIVVGVFGGVPNWIEFDLERPKAGVGISISDQASIKASVGLLQLTGNEQMFAIDGQHRVEAITRAWTAGTRGKGNRLDISEDQYSIILVAHVDDEGGKKRTRRLFSDINKRAVPVSKGDLAIIDEEDICAIVARRLYAEYEPFKKLGPKPISLTKNTNLDPKDTTHFTNLLTLVSVNRRLKPLYSRAKATLEFQEENVIALQKIADGFFDFVIPKCSDLNRLFSGKSTLPALRNKSKSLLVRPIGLELLARLYTFFSKRDELNLLGKGLGKIDFRLPGPHFNRLLWNKSRIENKNKATAYELCLYLMGCLNKAESATLLDTYRQALKDPKAKLPVPVVRSSRTR